MVERRVSRLNIGYTALIVLNHFAFGISCTVIWPALVDLKHIFQDSGKIELAATFMSGGYAIGALSGWLYKWLNRQLTLTFMLFITGTTLILVPHYPNLTVLFMAVTLNGVGGGTWDSNFNVWLAEIWKERCNTIMNVCQFFYGVGSMLGPFIVSYYVKGDDAKLTPDERRQELQVPFLVSGAFQLLVPSLFFVLYLMRPYVNKDSGQQLQIQHHDDEPEDYEAEESQVDVLPEAHTIANRSFKILLVALCIATYGAVEISYFYFSPTMLQYLKPVSFTAKEAAHIMSYLSGAYAAGRLITVFVSMKLKPDTIVTYHFVIVVSSLTLLYFGRANRTLIYIGSVLIGYGFSAMWPGTVAFTEHHLRLTDGTGAFIFSLNGFVCLLAPFVIETYIELHAEMLFLNLGVYLLISICMFAALRIMVYSN